MMTSTFVLLVALSQAAPQPPVPPPTATPTVTTIQPAGAPDYIVGPADVLQVTVQGVPDFTRPVTVDQDGTFDFPLIGRVAAGGKGVRAIEAEIKRMIEAKRLLVNPSVSVDVTAFRSQVVYVMGAVGRAGGYKIAGNATIMSVLAEAGFSLKSGSTITITRWPKGSKASGPASSAPNAEVIKVSRKELEDGRAQGITLQDGDTINVPNAETFTITGYIRSPGVLELSDGMTVLQALAIAGGVTDQGAANRIEIQRVGVAKPIKKVKPTDLVKAGDIITVPRRRM